MSIYVITGGTTGIGAATREKLQEQGHEVFNIDYKGGDYTADLYVYKRQCQYTLSCKRNLSRFLRDDYHNRVGYFAHAQSGAMPGSQAYAYFITFCQRQNTSCRTYHAVSRCV